MKKSDNHNKPYQKQKNKCYNKKSFFKKRNDRRFGPKGRNEIFTINDHHIVFKQICDISVSKPEEIPHTLNIVFNNQTILNIPFEKYEEACFWSRKLKKSLELYLTYETREEERKKKEREKEEAIQNGETTGTQQ